MVNNFTTINKNKQSPELTEHNKDDGMWRCKSSFGMGQAQKWGRIKLVIDIPTLPFW